MAVPRLAPFDGDSVALPRPLAAPDAALLRRLYAAKGSIADLLRAATPLDRTARLNDELLATLLADRYLAQGRRAPTASLAAWLQNYAGLPAAGPLSFLLHRRNPSSVLPVSAPPPAAPAATAPEEAEPTGRIPHRSGALDAAIAQRLRAQNPDAAARLIARTAGLDPLYAATLRAEVARAMFTHNMDDGALALARRAATQANGSLGLADYIAGLAAWRLGRPAEALSHFAAACRAPIAPPSLHAAAGYWAARASIATGDATRWHGWLDFAAAQKRTFYGLIAARMAGRSAGLDFPRDVLGIADVEAVAAEPGGQRAFALLQIGEPARAEAELRLLATRPGTELTRPVMLVAERAGLFDVAADLAADLEKNSGAALDADRFPVPRLRPRNGFLMDPALVYALSRIESNFRAAAVSPMGAQGLMQLMPHTAGAMAHGPARLQNPGVNLDLGQRYVAYLADRGAVDDDLIGLLASYNAGPGNFAGWSATIRAFHDPLLFIEAIPNDETRAFVQHALAYTWIYAAPLHLPTPSLDALAAGQPPRFSAGTSRIDLAVLH